MGNAHDLLAPPQDRRASAKRPASRSEQERNQGNHCRSQRVSLGPLEEVQPAHEESQWMGHAAGADAARMRQQETPSDLMKLETLESNYDEDINRPRRGHFRDSGEPITPVRRQRESASAD